MDYLCVNLHKSTTHFHSQLNGRGYFPCTVIPSVIYLTLIVTFNKHEIVIYQITYYSTEVSDKLNIFYAPGLKGRASSNWIVRPSVRLFVYLSVFPSRLHIKSKVLLSVSTSFMNIKLQ